METSFSLSVPIDILSRVVAPGARTGRAIRREWVEIPIGLSSVVYSTVSFNVIGAASFSYRLVLVTVLLIS